LTGKRGCRQVFAEQLRLVNDRRFRGQAISRRALFEELERDALQPLPATRYEFAAWKPARVNIDCHVEFDTRYYSVPYELSRQVVARTSTPTAAAAAEPLAPELGGSVLRHDVRITARARHRRVLLRSDYPPYAAAREPL
jgi:hypothetical protein